MISYSSELHLDIQKKIEKDKDTLIVKNAELQHLIDVYCKDEKQSQLAKSISSKLFNIYPKIYDLDASLLHVSSSVRFILELLIHTELLVKESDYFEKFYYGLAFIQERKNEILNSKLNSDRKILEKYLAIENEINNKIIYSENENQLTGMQSEIDDIYAQLNNELTIFLDSIDEFGIQSYDELVLDPYLQTLNERSNLLLNHNSKLEASLSSNIGFNKKFDLRGQKSKIRSTLKDKRNWKQKADSAGLLDEYDFIYEYTSSIIHCSSYSILTNEKSAHIELRVLRNIANKYVNRILNNMLKFCSIPVNAKIFQAD